MFMHTLITNIMHVDTFSCRSRSLYTRCVRAQATSSSRCLHQQKTQKQTTINEKLNDTVKIYLHRRTYAHTEHNDALPPPSD